MTWSNVIKFVNSNIDRSHAGAFFMDGPPWINKSADGVIE